jgi:hypothetical protein
MKLKDIETYTATADAEVAMALAATESPFKIEVRFLEGLTQTQQDAFKTAADRWIRIIVGDLPSVMVNGELVDDLLIFAEGRNIDGRGKILGEAGPRRLRPAAAGRAAFLPATGQMSFDTADLAEMEQRGTLVDVITHEMGHVLGIGLSVWNLKRLIAGAGGIDPTFLGEAGNREYGILKNSDPTPIPIENEHGPGTRDSHWRDSVFANELMTGFVGSADNPISRMTVASLQDMGYVVNPAAAEPYSLPNLALMAESGELALRAFSEEEGMVLPSIPIVLPDESLQ